ncbi:hypothetical protein MIND_01025800 [Mycena indigotica]|uniref:Uncharacterized protein n=1 Tax=Mycena indigotica TaxID=2126181 RepID=A0A8H6W0H6_9AGAR|nr:uncharacterized protein MIND_01025800 [Mycena indigotica]KAF7294879.1 hypothetical protein MIND_01025800 [Mycena indigotica]
MNGLMPGLGYEWGRPRIPVACIPAGQLVLCIDNDLWYARPHESPDAYACQSHYQVNLLTCKLHRVEWHSQPISGIVDSTPPPTSQELELWEDIQMNSSWAIPCVGNGPMLVAGCRVTLPLNNILKGQPASGMIVDTELKGTCRVRVSRKGEPLDMNRPTLIDDLLSPPEEPDEVLIDRRNLSPHFINGPVDIQIGDRVVILSGHHLHRIGIVERLHNGRTTPLLTIIDNHIPISNVAISNVARLFLPGDPVVILYGAHNGIRGNIEGTFALRQLDDEQHQFPPGGIRVQADYANIAVNVPTQFVRFDVRIMGADPSRAPVNVDRHWLARDALVGKSLKVRLGPVLRGRMTEKQAIAIGKQGHIILQEAVCPQTYAVPMQVEIDRERTKVTIAPEWLHPSLYDVKARVMETVVVIGPDAEGSEEHIGRYAHVEPGQIGWPVKAVITTESDAIAHFPQESLCITRDIVSKKT